MTRGRKSGRVADSVVTLATGWASDSSSGALAERTLHEARAAQRMRSMEAAAFMGHRSIRIGLGARE